MFYRQLRCGVADPNYQLISADAFLKDPFSFILDNNKEWFVSIYEYSEDQYKQFQNSKSIAGIREVSTPRLVWDFDSTDDLELARLDTIELVGRLIECEISSQDIIISFSGNKGFGIEVETSHRYTVDEFKNITSNLAEGLITYDKVVNDAARIIRVLGTKNSKSGLYKYPLTTEQLKLSIYKIKKIAESLDNTAEFDWRKVSVDFAEFNKEKKKTAPVKLVDTRTLDFKKKPKFLTNCRWSLQNGYFEEGSRSTALLCLAASYKNLGFDLEHTYRLLKGVAELQAQKYGLEERYSDAEIYNNVVLQVYSSTWNGGQFTCRENGNFLYDYCQSLGDNSCKHKEHFNQTITTNEVFSLFKKYAENYEDNLLYTGIASLDKRAKLMVGTSSAILSPPGVGKTSMSLQILNHNSKNNIHSVFFSYDMYHSALYIRMLQRETGLDQDVLYDIFKHDSKRAAKLNEQLAEQYKNVHFCFRSGQTLQELEDTISDTEQNIGEKVKLGIVDYNELVNTEMSDSTASSALVAQKLRQIANEKELCMITLLQPAKQFSSPAEEITNFNAAKGSSAIVQSLTLLLGCSRPGFDPKNPENDRYFNITCLKNRNGPLFSQDLSWEGISGKVGELSDEARIDLAALRERKEQEKKDDSLW